MARIQTPARREEAKQSLVQIVSSPAFSEQLRRALPRAMNADRFLRIVLTQLRRIQNLSQCTSQSFFGCVIEAAQVGLEPGVLGQCWILPYYNTKKKVYEAQLVVGYRGLVQLAYRSQLVRAIWAREVYDGDRFVWEEGLLRRLEHTPGSSDHDPARITHTYAVVETASGGIVHDVMTRKDVDAVRARAKAKDYGPWATDFAEMAKKTVLRRLLKVAPQSVELQRVLDSEEKSERGEQNDYGLEAAGALAVAEDQTPQVEQGSSEEPVADQSAEQKPEPEIDPETGEVIPEWVGR